MLDSRLNKTIEREFENLNRARNKQVLLNSILILMILTSFYFLEPTITGLITVENQINYSDNIKLEFNESTEYIWIPEQQGLLKSIGISGSYETEGNVKVYLEEIGIKYLIFESGRLDAIGLDSITGLVVLNESDNSSIIDQTININSIINDALEFNRSNIIEINNNQSLGKNESIDNNEIKEKIINKTITVNLEYKKDSNYDVDNDGIEDIYGVVDLTVENTNFNWQINDDKLCTRWNIESLEDEVSTILCNGNQNCCAFVELVSTSSGWNDTLFLTYGLHESTFYNKISAQIIHVDFNLSLENPYSEIYYSEWEELPVKFYEQFSSFENVCGETCILSLNKTSYKLIIEIDNSILKIDNINYLVEDEKKIDKISKESYEELNKSRVIINKPVKWLKKVKLDRVRNKVSINITSFATNITVKKIEDESEEVIPETKIKIRDKGKIKDLKEYEIDKEIEKEEKNIDKETDLGKIRELEVRISELESKKDELINLITGNVIVEETAIADDDESTQVIIDDLVEEIEIEYFTEGPVSEEIEIDDNKKQIVISSDIHYEDILAFTFLPKEVEQGTAKLFWIINDTRVKVEIDEYDTNENSLVDYVEWNVPSLSSQTYELIIEISQAEHLDSNKIFVKDVYEIVKARDDIWTAPIPVNNYIRVTFEQNLTNDKDITIFARSDQDASVEVYGKDESVSLGIITSINEDNRYQLLLTNLIGSQDVFDLRIKGYPIEFDYIVDPDTTLPKINGTFNKSINNILEGDVINVTFNATDDINLTNATIIINDTGINRYFNFSLNGSGLITLEFSQNFTVNCSSSCVVNITGIARDNSSNEAQNETIITIQDVTQPTSFDLITPIDGTRSTDLTPSLDWENTTEPNFKNYSIEFSSSSSFSFINHSFKPEGNATNSTFTLTISLTPNINWTWRVIAYDTFGNSRISTNAYRFETFQNRKPTSPFNILPNNNTVKFYNDINFTWTKSNDPDDDDITYDLLIAKDIGFTDIDLNRTGIIPNHLDLEENGSILSGDRRYWKVRAFDDANYSDYSDYFDLTVIVARLNITAPAVNNTRFYPGNKTEINIQELNGTDWIQNVTVEYNNTNYTASNTGDNWAVNISFSDIRSNYRNITAYGFNQTRNLTITAKKQIIFSKVATRPRIDYICSNETFALNSSNIKIQLKASLDAVVDYSNATLTNPSDIIIPLNISLIKEELSGENDILYRYEDTYFVNETGNYTINSTIVDIEGNSFNSTFSFEVVTAVRTINVSGINIDNINLNDICTNEPITNGTTIIRTIPEIALYNVEIRTTKPTVVFKNINLSNTTLLLNYTDLKRNISAPSEQRIITEFEINSNISKYETVTVSFNYTSLVGALDDENGLRIYKCPDQASCSSVAWERQIANLNTTNNIISTTGTDLSVFLVSETTKTTTTETVTTTTTVSAGGAGAAGGGGGVIIRIASLDFIVPSSISLNSKDNVIVPIVLKNSGEINLNDINLSYDTNAEGITIEFDDPYFEILKIDENVSTNARIITDIEELGEYVFTLYANVSSPKLTASADIIIDVIDKYEGNRSLVEERIKFSLDLFEKNPECLVLKELLAAVETALENKEFEKALRLTESGISTCRDLLDEKIKKPIIIRPSKEFGFKITLPLAISVLIIFISLLIYGIRSFDWTLRSSLKFSFNKKHRYKRIGPTKKEIKTFENEEKDIQKLLSR